tara:strand:- start:54 stop:296 length:243 start_codon:yes stop_codon:yes gene_type:complete
MLFLGTDKMDNGNAPVTQKVAAALGVLEFLREQEQPLFMISGPEEPKLVPSHGKKPGLQEVALRKAAMRYLIQYFYGEMD